MINVVVVRHANTDETGHRLSGRTAGVGLNEEGARAAQSVARRLRAVRLQSVYCGPLERARATADAIAREHGQPVIVRSDLDEIDFGEWTGCTFASLAAVPMWHVFNDCPHRAHIPGGEPLADVAKRAAAALRAMAARHHDGETIVAVSHGDVIRLALARLLGWPLQAFRRLEVAPASISCLRIGDGPPVLALLNERPGQDQPGKEQAS